MKTRTGGDPAGPRGGARGALSPGGDLLACLLHCTRPLDPWSKAPARPCLGWVGVFLFVCLYERLCGAADLLTC